MTTLTWIYIYILYTILTNFDHPNKYVKQYDLRTTRIWIQQK